MASLFARWYDMSLVYEASLVYWQYFLMLLSAVLSGIACLVSKIGYFFQLALRLWVSWVHHVITRCHFHCKTSSTFCFGTLSHCLQSCSLEIRSRCSSTFWGSIIFHEPFFDERGQLSQTSCGDYVYCPSWRVLTVTTGIPKVHQVDFNHWLEF